jgi:Effector-associated domain 7/TIR domain
MCTKLGAIKVFISYSHNTDIPDFRDQILALSDRLRSDSIDCSIDQYENAPPQGWPRWMLDRVEWADFVLVACSEEYDRRFRGNEAYGRGKGATWEGGIIIQELYDAQGQNSKFIPIVLNPEDSKFISSPLRGATYYRLQSNDDYDLLYRRLTNQHDTPVSPLGTVRQMPVRDRKQHFMNGLSTKKEQENRVEAATKSVALHKNRSIRKLIEETLSDDDLSNLCQDEFPRVYGQFTTGQTKSYRIRLLVEYTERQRETSKLLNAIRRINSVAHQEFIGDEASDSKTQGNLVQNNVGNAQGFQTEVHGGIVYIGGEHIHDRPHSSQATSSDSSLKIAFDLSIEAKKLLLAAFESPEKTIEVNTIKNFRRPPVIIIRVDNHSFDGEQASLTNYQYALEQLVEEGLIDQLPSGNRVFYKLKRKGFDFCIMYNKSLPAKALALQNAVNQQVAAEIAKFKAIGQSIYYSKNGKLIREDADGRTFEYTPLPDGGEELISET